MAVVAVLCVAGLPAVVLSPVFSPVDVVAPVVSLVVSLLVFGGLHRLAATAYDRAPAAGVPIGGAPVGAVAEGGPDPQPSRSMTTRAVCRGARC